MTTKFEQLIEYVINDEEAKAKELFHEIVVEKSREIYENLMNEEEQDEELDEAAESEEDAEELEEAEAVAEEEELDETFGGSASADLIDDVETEEEGLQEEDEEGEEVEFGAEEGEEESGEDLEDRVVDLEDKLDELMAEFEAMMGDEGKGDDFGVDGGDALEVDDTEEFDNGEGEEDSEEFELAEGIDLKAAPKPTTSEEGSVNKKNVVANNSGAAGMASKPVSTTGGEEKGRPAPTAKDLGVTPTQDAGNKAFKSAAPAPVKTQAAGVNARSPLPKG